MAETQMTDDATAASDRGEGTRYAWTAVCCMILGVASLGFLIQVITAIALEFKPLAHFDWLDWYVSIFGLLSPAAAAAGLIVGRAANRQIAGSRGRLKGRGLVTAGCIISAVVLIPYSCACVVILIFAVVRAVHHP